LFSDARSSFHIVIIVCRPPVLPNTEVDQLIDVARLVSVASDSLFLAIKIFDFVFSVRAGPYNGSLMVATGLILASKGCELSRKALCYPLIDKYMPQPPRWVMEFGFQVSISLEYGLFEKLNKSNRIRLCGFLKNNLPVLGLTIH
jgi:hypothetical protein